MATFDRVEPPAAAAADGWAVGDTVVVLGAMDTRVLAAFSPGKIAVDEDTIPDFFEDEEEDSFFFETIALVTWAAVIIPVPTFRTVPTLPVVSAEVVFRTAFPMGELPTFATVAVTALAKGDESALLTAGIAFIFCGTDDTTFFTSPVAFLSESKSPIFEL